MVPRAEPEVDELMSLKRLLVAGPVALALWGSAVWAQDGGGEDVPAAGAASADPATTGSVGTGDAESPAGAIEAGELARELLSVEEEVKRLKERVFRSKATLQLLKELVIEGATLGSRIAVWHVNKMGPAYTMESIDYYLDDKSVFRRVDPSGTLDDLREVKVHEQTVPPGSHRVEVNLVLRGAGFGVFSYLRTYSFKVQSSYTVDVGDGALVNLRVIADERSGLSRTFMDRPYVEYDVVNADIREE
jgi:hypothetical protein